MNIDYRGLAAAIIATSLGLAIVISVTGLAWRDRPLQESGRDALIAIGSALVGALAGYMGGRHNGKEP